jgi:hypothetical protein
MDLTSFTDSAHDFKHIQRVIAQLTDPKLVTGATLAPRCAVSWAMGRLPQVYVFLVCSLFEYLFISFFVFSRVLIGCSDVYREITLHRYNTYVVCLARFLIDPTAPTELVSVDPVGANFSPPVHPEVFEPPPPPAVCVPRAIDQCAQAVARGS